MSTVRAASQRDLIPDRLAHHASTRPDDPALLARTASGDFTPISWQQYDQRVRLVAAACLAVGVPVGGAVAILGDSRAEWVLAAVGTLYAGGVATGIYQTSTADQVAYILSVPYTGDASTVEVLLSRLDDALTPEPALSLPLWQSCPEGQTNDGLPCQPPLLSGSIELELLGTTEGGSVGGAAAMMTQSRSNRPCPVRREYSSVRSVS